MVAYLRNLFGGSAEAHNETVVNNNETIISQAIAWEKTCTTTMTMKIQSMTKRKTTKMITMMMTSTEGMTLEEMTSEAG